MILVMEQSLAIAAQWVNKLPEAISDSLRETRFTSALTGDVNGPVLFAAEEEENMTVDLSWPQPGKRFVARREKTGDKKRESGGAWRKQLQTAMARHEEDFSPVRFCVGRKVRTKDWVDFL